MSNNTQRRCARPNTRSPLLTVLLFLLGAGAACAEWKVYEKCTLIPQPFNDGDSFHVKAGRRHYIFRLYFVDAPETEDSYATRVADQAEYFGITPEKVMALGKQASRFTREFLAKPFTVYTERQNARGQSRRTRYFAMIETDAGFLSNALVREGLARVYGCPTVLPDGTPASKYFARLRAREREAKRAGNGGWADELQDQRTRPPAIEPGERTLTMRIPVYALDRPDRFIGLLSHGAKISVLGARAGKVHIRFHDGKKQREALCNRRDLGL